MFFEDITDAYKRISGSIHKTPVVRSSTLDKVVGRNVFIKCESFQKTGSHKARGALNAILKLKEQRPDVRGVAAYSSGNHGMALAWAARNLGLVCVVVVPHTVHKVKVASLKDYGAEVVFCEPSPQSREETCERVAAEKGLVVIPPCNQSNVVAGQGTVGVEFLEQTPDLDAIFVPVSGGATLAGVATAATHIKPSIKIFAVEPAGKNLEPCLKAGKRLWPEEHRFLDTIADGVRLHQIGHDVFPIVCQLVEKNVFTVTDDDIIAAMKFTFQRMKLVIEAASATVVAAVLSEKIKTLDPIIRNIGIIVTGGNTDVENLPWH